MRAFLVSIFFLIKLIFFSCHTKDWTWCYRKKFTLNETKELSNKQNLTFSKLNVPNYNQLIFCWNAYRPTKGYFSFWIQPRNAVTKKWGNWFKMYDWGKDIQQSYSKIIDEDISYIHVRLEMPKNKFADAFRLKIESNFGADLSLLKMLNVCISNYSLFETEANKKFKLNSVKIDKVKKRSQMVLKHEDCKRMCSPTSTSMLVNYLSKKEIDPINFALNAYDYGLKAYGSWPFNIAHAFEQYPNYFFKVVRLGSFNELYAFLLKKIPVVVSVRGFLKGAPQEYNSGHLILIIGFDRRKQEIIVHDPAFDCNNKVLYHYNMKGFLKAWEKSYRLAYIVEKR